MAGAALFGSQGLAGTGIKQILADAEAPFSSLYHHFPGGKDELAAAALRRSGAEYQQLVEAVWDEQHSPVASVAAVFDGAARTLEDSGYAEACPIATVALEVASTNEPLRVVTAEVFASWVAAGTGRLVASGLAAAVARSLSLTIISLLEGAFVLCQAAQSAEPMRAAGTAAVSLVRAAAGREATG